MAYKDLHDEPFDEGTIIKLDLFEDYAAAWIPTFIMGSYKELWIFDFFAGTGYDLNRVPGSAIRILKQLSNHVGNIFQKEKKVNICFNEFNPKKYKLLIESSEQFLQENPDLSRAINVIYENKDFTEVFPKYYKTICNYPSLVYLDQNGMKFLSDKYLLELERCKTTDFLYFLSSSYFLRFGETEEFQSNLKIDLARVKDQPYNCVHKSILEQLKEKLPQESELKLYPFTIKKPNGVYGIIFGTKHARGVDKFLKAAWKRNSINGEANFDIDDDQGKRQLDIFKGKQLTKREYFAKSLREKILEGSINTNLDAFHYAIEQGHISKHAFEVVVEMKKMRQINYSEKSPLINYEQIYQNNRIVTFVRNGK